MYAIFKKGGYPQVYPVILTHIGTTVTIVSDPFDVLASATHNTTGIIDIVWNDRIVEGAGEPPCAVATVGFGNITASILSPDENSCQINTKLISSGANFTAGGYIFLMVASHSGKK